jgi:flagellar motility protein MotE (MotC chaperone)
MSILLFFLLSLTVSGEDKKKTYTEKEFLDAVEKEMDSRLKKYRPSNMVSLSQELMKKERAFDLKEQELKRANDSLKAGERDLQSKLKELQSKSKKLLGCLDENDENQSKRVGHMVDVVSGMRPQNAADILSVQDVDIAVKILGKLDPTKVSKIFNSMDKEISARLQKQYMSMKR